MNLEYDEAEEIATTPLEEAITIAQTKIDAFQAFSYNDVGLKYQRRSRLAFKDWARENNIEFKRTRISGRGGSQDALFYPFYIDETGKKILAPGPKTEE